MTTTFLLANWSTPADFDCFRDDPAVDSVADPAKPRGFPYPTLDAAKAACVADVAELYDDPDERAVVEKATWSSESDGYHNLRGGNDLLAVLVVWEFTI